jgi:hypothetical protein
MVTLYAADAGDRAATLATGDFNGDGATDVLFAAAFADGPGNARPDAGEAYVFLGPFQTGEARDAASGQQDVTISGADEGDQAGRAAIAADVNGDGYDDIVLGVPFGDGPDGARTDAGETVVILGGPNLGQGVSSVDLRDGADQAIYGRAAGDLAGFALAAGELSGDEAADLVIGAFMADGPDGARPDAGEVYVIHGAPQLSESRDLAGGAFDAVAYGPAPDVRLGESVAVADTDGDGLDNLVLPAAFAAARSGATVAGQTYLLRSPVPRTTDLQSDRPEAIIYGVDTGDQLGHSLAAGDVDGDGRQDMLLGAVSSRGEDNADRLAGEAVLVLAGSLSGVVDVAAGDGDLTVFGADPGDRLGQAVAIGDLDGDGRGELLLGASDGDGAARTDSGEVFVLEGVPAGPLRLPTSALVQAGPDAGDSLGSSVFGKSALLAADLDGDGASELLVSAPLADGPDNGRRGCGEAYLIFAGLKQ